MAAKEQQQLGELIGEMKWVKESLTSLHGKVEAMRDRCEPCKKEMMIAVDNKIETSKMKNKLERYGSIAGYVSMIGTPLIYWLISYLKLLPK